MRYVPTVNDDSLKKGLTVSAGLHFLMFLFLFFGLPRLIPPLPSHHESVPFEIVTIADITNTRLDEKKEDIKPPAPPPAPQPKAQPAPPQQQEKPKPPAPKPPEPAAEQQAEALKPKPIQKPKPPVEKPAPPQQDMLASVLKNVAKMKPAPVVQNPNAKSDVKAPSQAAPSMAPSVSSRLSITEEDALRRQIEQCWNPPVGARDAQNLIVEVIIDVNADRTVSNAEIVDKGRYASDPFFRAAADSAVRAVRNPNCNPLELSADKYDQWKRINFTFDPRDML